MSALEFTVATARERPEIAELAERHAAPEWPAFMLEDPVARKHWAGLYRDFPALQFALFEASSGELLASGNSIALAWDGDLADLPDAGWDWALERGFKDRAAGRRANIQCALEVTIPSRHRGKGLSGEALLAMKALGRAQGLEALVAPVRPNQKALYPLTPMARYARWRDAEGLAFDAWMRVHERLGADILKVCPHSMRIPGTVAEWERWTGMRFPESGPYIVSGALVPVEIDVERNLGLYIEPDVWMRHPM